MGAKDRERIDARLAPQQKRLIEQAAELAGVSVVSFVVSSAIRQAHAIIAEHSRTTLSLTNARRFAEILENDEPSPALVAAMKKHKARRGKR